jgi:hypothetical protein
MVYAVINVDTPLALLTPRTDKSIVRVICHEVILPFVGFLVDKVAHQETFTR